MNKYFIYNYIDKKVVEKNLSFEEANNKANWNEEIVEKHIPSINFLNFVDWITQWETAFEEHDYLKIEELKNDYPEYLNEHKKAIINAFDKSMETK